MVPWAQPSPQPKQHLLQGSLVWQTDRQIDRPTEHATRSVTIGRIYVHSTAMRPNNNKGLCLLPSYTAITYICTVNITNNKLATMQDSSEQCNTNNQQQPNMTHRLALSCYVQALGFWSWTSRLNHPAKYFLKTLLAIHACTTNQLLYTGH